ncbi:hypothetical protein [Sphingomonas sp. CROZ-RG-20F-R02-07]|uniref:hypothetical protein n=1 Tax=Sphingomonas sp. CROZ-RG-20F-R02-07 TaxID=2914832 RepID=UPI001F5A9834|nr:hypothetical protein [Sphingomonas sp. CROZ-RG-20F-R02-07]
MPRSPFIDDPRAEAARHVAAAVASPIESLAALHIDLAEHFAAVAKTSGLPPKGKRTP